MASESSEELGWNLIWYLKMTIIKIFPAFLTAIITVAIFLESKALVFNVVMIFSVFLLFVILLAAVEILARIRSSKIGKIPYVS